ncbi:HAD family hydrolase [Falsiroseomonas tokyonensis]|uniref:HAD family hydrolase n=1 Tax=Falsiroseomonas tokyonensis TaxID=430521 RepID=A0ABV7BN04_9PROT|nr:HAD family phosphatase [Falsiroseomonas tokyonensis]MBU8536925.1 HAD family phosphatase [Falsiroseomonas tokyonensis]
MRRPVLRPAAVLFDCDGVLADSEALHNRIIAEEISALGWEMDAAEAERRFIGLSWRNIVPLVQARLGPDSVPADFVEGVVARVLRALRQEVVPVPGVQKALRAILAAGIPVAVASNSSRPELLTKLHGLGLTEVFRGRTFSYDDVALPKPAPDMYRAAAEACGADPRACVVVEDSVTGSRAGRAAGCRVLGFAHATDPAELTAVGAEVFHEMAALPGLLGLNAESLA